MREQYMYESPWIVCQSLIPEGVLCGSLEDPDEDELTGW